MKKTEKNKFKKLIKLSVKDTQELFFAELIIYVLCIILGITELAKSSGTVIRQVLVCIIGDFDLIFSVRVVIKILKGEELCITLYSMILLAMFLEYVFFEALF